MDPEDECLQMHLLTEYGLSPINSRVVNGQLLGCLRSQNTKSFRSLLEKLPKSGIDVNRVYPNGSNETCLDIVCKKGLHEFVRILLENGANVNRINEEESRAAIHYATEKGHEDVLQVLLEDPQINPNLRAGGQTALHIAVTTKNLRCAKLLLAKGASPNVPNSKGLTALHVAAMKKQRPMAELILDTSERTPDLDSYKDYNGETTRDVLGRNMPELLLPPRIERRPDVNDLRYHLKANDETSFLECLRTMPNNAPIEIEDLIVEAVQQNFKNAVSELLERRTTRYNLEKAADIAIQKGSPHILRRIMDNFDDADPGAANRLLLTACIELGIPGGASKKSVSNRLECLRLILDREDVDVHCTDEKRNTPLHHAARADSREAVVMLLEKGSYIGQTNKYGSPAVADISSSALSQYFDDCIQARKEGRNGYLIEFDYKCLIPQNNNQQRYRQMDVFQSIAGNSGLKHLLKHPLLSSFIDLKWQRIGLVLNVSFVFHLLLYILLSVYIISKISDENENPTDQASPEQTTVSVFGILAGMLLAVFALWKLFQLILSPCCYLSNIKNWCEMGLAVLGFFMLYGEVISNSIAAVVILSFAWLLVVKMGHYSMLSMDIEMFITVFRKFVRFLAVYAILIFSFAVAFFVLFKDQKSFLNLGHSMFKTIIMLTGEFDTENISFDAEPFTSHLVFVVFVFMITIVLFNLLNGLAVNDTAEIVGKAELVGLISKIRMISDVENLAISTPRDHSPHCWLFNTSLCFWRARPIPFLADQVLVSPKYFEGSKLKIDPNISKMDSGIVKRAREILSRRDRETDTERIIGELEKVKDMLSSLKLGLDNNNVNVGRDS